MNDPCLPGTLFEVAPVRSVPVPGGVTVQARVVDHDWFGEMLAPETTADFATIAGAIATKEGLAGWRGQSSLCWQLDSSLTRRVRGSDRAWLLGVGKPFARAVREMEARVLGRARLAGHDRREQRTLSDLELSAVLQHHGAATRLLDCTYNAYVALWFASRDRPDEWGLVAGFNLLEAWPVLTATQRDLPMPELLAEIGDGFAVWRPSTLSPRIAAQQGFFVFSDVADKAWGSAIFRGDQIDMFGTVPGVNLFAVSPELKKAFADVWSEQFGYTNERLFPDLDGFCRAHGPDCKFPAEMYKGDNLIP